MECNWNFLSHSGPGLLMSLYAGAPTFQVGSLLLKAPRVRINCGSKVVGGQLLLNARFRTAGQVGCPVLALRRPCWSSLRLVVAGFRVNVKSPCDVVRFLRCPCRATSGGHRSRGTWLILPVVICLSQRLSHACLSISFFTVKLRMAH